jgi:hypothetical protein
MSVFLLLVITVVVKQKSRQLVTVTRLHVTCCVRSTSNGLKVSVRAGVLLHSLMQMGQTFIILT